MTKRRSKSTITDMFGSTPNKHGDRLMLQSQTSRVMFKKGTKSAIRRIAEVVWQSTVASPKFTETGKNGSELMINLAMLITTRQIIKMTWRCTV